MTCGAAIGCRARLGRVPDCTPVQVLHPPLLCVLRCQNRGPRSPGLAETPDFDPRALAARNAWTALCGAERQLLIEFPYSPINVQQGAGFEDWSWYSGTVARGFRHVVVRGTAHFVRLKRANSLQEASRGFQRLPSIEFAEYLAGDDTSRPHNL